MVLDAVLAALAGALCYAIAAALQHHEAARADTHDVLNPVLLWQLAHRPLWLAGIASTGLGAALHIFALSEAPLVLVQPLGVTCLIFAVPLAAGLNHHRVRVSELVAALAILAGLAAVVSAIPGGDPMAVAVQVRAVVLLLLGAGGLIGGLALMDRRVAQRPAARSLVLALGAGVAFGATSALARVLLQLHDRSAAAETMVLAGAGIVVLAPLGFLLMQSAYRSGGFTVALAAITVVDPLVAATSGVVLLHEPLAATPAHALLVAAGAVLATLGISVLARSPVHAPTHAAGDAPGTGQPQLLSRTPADARSATNHPRPTELDAAPIAHPRSLRRLLIGTDTYHPDVNGAAYFTYRLAIGLARRGHDVHVVRLSADGVASTRVEDGVTVHRIRSFCTPVHPEFRVCLPTTAASGTAAILRAVEPDIVHVQGHFPIGRSLLRAARRQRVPVVATNHFMPENLLAYGHVPAVARRIACELAWRDFARVFNQADHITTPTPIAAELIRRRGLRPPAQAVSCGIDLDRCHASGNGTRDILSASSMAVCAMLI